MQHILQKIGEAIIGISLAIAGLFGFGGTPTENVGATIPVNVAVFQTSLQASITSSANAMTLVSGTDKAGNALTGYICYNIDEGTSTEEFVCGTTAGTAVSSLVRGIDPVDGDLEVTALKKAHRRGASVKITNYPSLAIISRVLNGNETFPNKISYTSHPTFTADTQIIDKKYADDLAIAGSPDATTSAKGISKMSYAPASSTNPIAVGDNDPRVPTQDENDALAGTSGTPSTSNKFVTNADTAETGASKVLRLTSGGKVTTSTIDTGVTDGKIIIATTGDKLPVIDGSNLTNLPGVPVIGATTATDLHSVNATSTTITHNLGVIPRFVRIITTRTAPGGNNLESQTIGIATIDNSNGTVTAQYVSSNAGSSSYTSNYSGTNITGVFGTSSAYQFAPLSGVSSTQMTITFAGVGYGSIQAGGTMTYLWEVYK